MIPTDAYASSEVNELQIPRYARDDNRERNPHERSMTER